MKLFSYAAVVIAATYGLGDSLSGTKTNDAKSLDGTWQCISVVGHAGPLPDDTVKTIKVTITGTRATLIVAGNTVNITIKTEFTTKPAEIDVLAEDGPTKGKTCLGLFMLKNGELTIRFGYPGKKRPESLDFGSDYTVVVVLKRMK